MKKILIVLCAAALVCSCTNRNSSKAQQTAENFLTSYLTMNYEGIEAYCDSLMLSVLDRSTRSLERLDTALQAKMKDAAAQTRFEVTSVDEETEKGKAHVTYMLYPVGSEKGQEMSLTLAKQGNKWVVTNLY
ncbi:MAG: hypothetical protein IKX11_06290 [Bacteroidales bacterium]|nr:hypothetical protein [Bacteroidales bacterium]